MNLTLVGKNALIYAVGNVGMRATAFLLIPLYTHGLSLNEYGMLATLQLTMQAMIGFMNCGMPSCLLRFTKDCKGNNIYGNLLGTSSFINLLAGIMVTGISLIFLTNFFRNVLHLNNVSPYIYLACGAAFAQSLAIHLMSYYRAEDKARKFMVIGISSSLFLILANAVSLYGFNLGIKGALWSSIATYSIFLLFLSWDIFSKTGVGISWPLMPSLLHFGFPLIFSDFALFIIGGASIYFLSYYSGLEAVAIFSLGAKLASVLSIAILLPFQLAFQPFIFNHLSRKDVKEVISRAMSYLFLAITLMFFIILFGSRILLPFIAPPEYSSAFSIILFLLPGVSFIGLYFIGETLLGAVKKTYLIGFMMSVYALLAVGLNYLLIPQLKSYGAVIATNVFYVFAGVTLLMLGKKYFFFNIEWRKIRVCGMIFTLFFSVFLILTKVHLETFVVVSLLVASVSMLVLSKMQFFSIKELTVFKDFF